VRVPAEAALGPAKVTLSFSDCQEAGIIPSVAEIRIVKAEPPDPAKQP
jgi:hypothetical protein